MEIAYLSLGSNLGDREVHLHAALRKLPSGQVILRRVSSVYETAPVDLTEQPDFLNLVAEVETALSPEELLAHVQGIERQLGRERTVAKGPRTVDIDILLCGNMVVNSADLQIPHPRMHLRRFVLEPLAELAPQFRHPVTGQTIAELLATVLNQTVRKADWNLML